MCLEKMFMIVTHWPRKIILLLLNRRKNVTLLKFAVIAFCLLSFCYLIPPFLRNAYQVRVENDLKERRIHLWNMCEKYKVINKITVNPKRFLISPQHGLAWCNIFKAASTTWVNYFNILAGYDVEFLEQTQEEPLKLAIDKYPRPKLKDLKDFMKMENSTTFLVVREPFERILSAYRDKYEHGRNSYYKKFGDKMIRKFRNSNSTNQDPGPTFSEFVQHVIYINKTKQWFDEHWSLFYKFCAPCSLNFTVIVKMETFQRDSKYIIRRAGLDTILLDKKMPKALEEKITNRSSNISTKKLIKEYFSEIGAELLRKLLSIYQIDFDLFDYDSSKYLQLISDYRTKNI